LVWHWNLRTPSRGRSQARARVGLMPRAKLAREPGGSKDSPRGRRRKAFPEQRHDPW
jgi:hypothetical protein